MKKSGPLSSPDTDQSRSTAGYALPGRALALLLGLLVVAGVIDFPFGQPLIGLILAAYAILLYRFGWAWLLALPAALPVIDLALWSGRFFFTEFDLLVMTTLAVLYWRQRGRRILPGILGEPYRLPAIMAALAAIALAIGLYPAPPLDANSFSTYLSHYNGLRVAKGFFEAWALLPLLLHEFTENPAATRRRLMAGVSLGLALAGICVLWERGVFVDLFWGKNRYSLLQGLLDFTATYRVTGMFSGMNVGDTAIDSYLALATPISLYFVFHGYKPWLRFLGLFVFGLGAYSVIVTFSRGLYGGFALALLLIACGEIFRLRTKVNSYRRQWLPLGLVFASATVLLFFIYGAGGYEGLIFGITAIVATAFVAPRFHWRHKSLGAILAILGAALTFMLIHRAIGHHKWSTTTAGTSFALAAASGLLLCLLPAAVSKPLGRLSLSTAAIGAMMLGIFWVGGIPPLSGIRVLERFSTTSEDLGTRQSHWRDSFAAMPESPLNTLFGAGTGSYPRLFFASEIGKMSLASYRFERQDDTPFMALGAGDFNMIQRIHLAPYTAYVINVDFRNSTFAEDPQKPGRLVAKLCHKHILYSERYEADCKIIVFQATQTMGWTHGTAYVNSGILGRYGMFYWPTTLMLQNGGSSIVDVTNLSLKGPDGIELVHNGNFAQGGDRWLLISDFKHLAWHAKNMYLHLYFEEGILGLAAFLALLAVGLNRLQASFRAGDASALFRFAALAAYAFVGLFGSNLDMPKVTTLFFLILFSALAPPLPQPVNQSKADHEPAV